MLIILLFITTVVAFSQNPEINDQFNENTELYNITEDLLVTPNKTVNVDDISLSPDNNTKTDLSVNNTIVTIASKKVTNGTEERFINKMFNNIMRPIVIVFSLPKIRAVLRNIGTCVVNGVMEVISYYLPAPVIPLIASAAGMMIPFEPVVLLKQKNPIENYRRALNSAMSSFLNTFESYKQDEDPYMTKMFNRRFMNAPNRQKKENSLKNNFI